MNGPLIEIRGLRVHAHHGVFEQERREGQEFVIDVWLRCRATPEAVGDRIERAVDYGAATERIVELASSGPFDLIESVADLIAADLAERFDVESATVRVAKPQAPIAHELREVAVTVTRPYN